MGISRPGWALSIIAVVTIITQIATLINPSSFIQDFKIDSVEAVRLIGNAPFSSSSFLE